MGHIDRQARIVVGVAHMSDTQGLRHRLQLAMAVGDAGRADVIALDQQQFDSHAPIERELCGGGLDRHAVLDRSGAGRQQAVSAGELHHAYAACTDRA